MGVLDRATVQGPPRRCRRTDPEITSLVTILLVSFLPEPWSTPRMSAGRSFAASRSYLSRRRPSRDRWPKQVDLKQTDLKQVEVKSMEVKSMGMKWLDLSLQPPPHEA